MGAKAISCKLSGCSLRYVLNIIIDVLNLTISTNLFQNAKLFEKRVR